MSQTAFKAKKGSKGQTSGPLTTADLIVLSLLSERAMHGYELLGEYDRQEVMDWALVSKAQVYYAIQKLARLKMISPKSQSRTETARDRTVYAPTDRGRSELVKSLTGSAWAHARVPQPFSTWLGLSIHLTREDVDQLLLARQIFLRDELARELASLEFIQTLDTPRARAGNSIVRLVIRQIEVELEWVGDLLNED
jgi:DNA-binding PadR family transcriptional regulator